MEDRARGEKALRCAEDLLHHGQLLVAKHDFERREFSVGAQHEDAIEPGVLLGLGAIDDEALLAGGRQEAAITAIADERLVALLQLPFEGCENRGAVGGVLLGLLVIAADDVAPPGERHCLRLVVDALATSGDGEGHEGARIVEYQFAHKLVGALAHAENVKKSPRFEFRDGLGADHAAVGDDARDRWKSAYPAGPPPERGYPCPPCCRATSPCTPVGRRRPGARRGSSGASPAGDPWNSRAGRASARRRPRNRDWSCP